MPDLQPHDLGPALRDGIKPPPIAAGGLMYPGRLHTITGPPESGKTVICLNIAINAIRRHSPVMFIDEEMGPGQTAALLEALGAEPELIEKFFHYLPFPSRRWHEEDVADLDGFIRAKQPVLSIWDSSAAIMAMAGLDEDRAPQVTRFWATVLAPIARLHHCAVLMTDHDSKNTEPSRYGRGSGAKLAGVDVAMKVKPLRPFTRYQNGMLDLRIVKDRLGFLHRDWQVIVEHDPLRLRFTQSYGEAEVEQIAGPVGMSHMQAGLLSCLTTEPADVKTLVARYYARFGHGMKYIKASELLRQLASDGHADRIDLPGAYTQWLKPSGTKPATLWRPTGPIGIVDRDTGEVRPA